MKSILFLAAFGVALSLGLSRMKTNLRKIIGRISRAFCVFSALAVTAANLQAATITVTNTADSGAGTLRATLASANNGDTINFALPAPATITLTSGQLLVSNSVNILGPGLENLALDGNGAGRVFSINPSNIVTISGLTISNGYATGSYPANLGGGIFNFRSTLTVSNCAIIANSSEGEGGAIENYAVGPFGNATLTIVTSVLRGNQALNNNNGGGIVNVASGGNAILTIKNSVLSDNWAPGGGGGVENEAYNGSIASVSIVGSTVSRNSALGGSAGGVENQADSNGSALLTVSDTTFDGNLAVHGGGAIVNGIGISGIASTGITNSLFTLNSANASGGALFNYGSTNSSVALVNCTLSGNSARDFSGGGVYNASGGASLLVLNSTFSGNSAGNVGGGSLYNFLATARIGSTIFSNGEGVFGVGSSGIISLGYNLCTDNGEGFLTNATDQINTNPKLGPLQDNGGPTFTHAPLPGSPAIDKGTNFSASATDQRGWPRTFDKAAIANAAGGDGTDIGAVESQSYTVVNTNDSGTGSLRQAIADSNAHPGTNTIDFAPSAHGTILLTSGKLLITNNVFIAGPGTTNEAVNGNAANRIFHFMNTIATIAGLTITNGYVPDNGDPGGAGIYNKYSTLTVSNCVLTGNRSDYEGGAIYNDGYRTNGAHLLIIGSMVNGNYAENGAAGVGNSFGSLHISNSSVSSNTVHNGSGGGIGNGGGALFIDHSSLNNNVAYYGGGIANYSGLSNTEATVISSTMIGNTAGSGAAIFNGIVGSVPTRDAIVSITNCVLANNVANGGGAIFNSGFGLSPASITAQIVNCTLSGNSAAQANGFGGAIFTGSSDATFPGNYRIVLLNSTLNGNSASLGGAIYISDSTSPVRLGSTILNQGASGGNIQNSYGNGANIAVTSLGYNLSSDSGSGLLNNATDRVNTDPLLGPLQDNGGPTFTHAPLPGSLAIDKGTNFSGSATDQRGFPRTVNIAGIPNAAAGDSTDIGAVEQDASLRLVNMGAIANQFGFNLVGPFTNVVVVEASTTFTNWTPLATNTLGDAAFRFNDPATATLPKRFYRARVQ